MITTLILSFIIGIIINLGLIYLAYLIPGRTQCSKVSILKASAIVAVISSAVTALSALLSDYVPQGCDLIVAVLLTYHCGRTMLNLPLKKAVLAAGLYFGTLLVLGIVLAASCVYILG